MHKCLNASLFFMTACALESSRPTEAIETAEDALADYRVEARVTSGPVAAGTIANLAIRVVGGNDVPVTAFDDLHTQPMHVVAVSSDLKEFVHVHPILAGDGTLTVAVPVARPQPYRLFFEYDPAGPAGEQTSRTILRPEGAAAVAPALSSETAFDGSVALATLAGSTRVELQPLAHGMIMAQSPISLRVAVKTTTGAPVVDLVDWLGMRGHAIVLSEDASTFIHGHATRAGGGGHGGHGGGGHGDHGGRAPETAGPAGHLLEIELLLPAAGLYKLFLQVKRDDTVITAPFVLRAVTM